MQAFPITEQAWGIYKHLFKCSVLQGLSTVYLLASFFKWCICMGLWTWVQPPIKPEEDSRSPEAWATGVVSHKTWMWYELYFCKSNKYMLFLFCLLTFILLSHITFQPQFPTPSTLPSPSSHLLSFPNQLLLQFPLKGAALPEYQQSRS